MVNMSKIILTIISTLSIVTMLGAFFYSSIIGVLGLTSTAATATATAAATSKIIDKASEFSKEAKTKLRKRVVQGVAKRSLLVGAQSYFPVVGGVAVGSAVIYLSAEDYCETSNIMDNLIRNLEGKKEKEEEKRLEFMKDCTTLIINDVMEATESTQDDFGEWANKSYENLNNKVDGIGDYFFGEDNQKISDGKGEK
jgi:hypothetical protein